MFLGLVHYGYIGESIMTINKAFALRVSELLNKKNMSKYKLEKASGLTHSALRYIFNENTKDVKFSTIAKIADALGVTIQEFFDTNLFDLSDLDYE